MLTIAFSAVIITVQIAFIVHVLRNDRPIYWAFIIFFFPMIGSAVYFFTEVLPELRGSPKARSTMREIRRSIDPTADLRALEQQHKLAGSIDSARHLANELIAAGQYDKAISHYREVLTGMYENDPDLLLGLAEAQFGNQDFGGAKETLERLAAENPHFKSAQGHLLYARALEKCGDLRNALEEYAAVTAYFAGAEARCRYATLLENEGRDEEALALFRDVLLGADVAPRHYRKAQKTWIDRASQGVRRLDA